jgi:hypothetical protein
MLAYEWETISNGILAETKPVGQRPARTRGSGELFFGI